MTLFTWLGKSERPVQIIASGRASRAASGMISGAGLASARISGRGPIRFTMSGFRTFAAETPRKTSAPSMISPRERALVSCAKALFHRSIDAGRPL
jgi:hypothetical protein